MRSCGPPLISASQSSSVSPLYGWPSFLIFGAFRDFHSHPQTIPLGTASANRSCTPTTTVFSSRRMNHGDSTAMVRHAESGREGMSRANTSASLAPASAAPPGTPLAMIASTITPVRSDILVHPPRRHRVRARSLQLLHPLSQFLL